MTRSAPRIAWRLIDAVAELDDQALPIAEVWRRVCRRAEQLGLPLPSYQQTRTLVHRSRRLRAMPGLGDLALDVVFRSRGPAEAVSVADRRLQERSAARAQLDAERASRPD